MCKSDQSSGRVNGVDEQEERGAAGRMEERGSSKERQPLAAVPINPRSALSPCLNTGTAAALAPELASLRQSVTSSTDQRRA